MRSRQRFVVVAVLVAFLAGVLLAPLAGLANEKGKRNTAIGLGGASVLMLLTQHNKLPGIVVGGGAVYAYSQYEREHQRNKRRAAYRRGYSDGRYGGYHARR